MDEHGFHNDGWYPHDGEGKGMCTGPGCNCDERNYGSYRTSGKGNGILYVLAIVFGTLCPPIGLIFLVILLLK